MVGARNRLLAVACGLLCCLVTPPPASSTPICNDRDGRGWVPRGSGPPGPSEADLKRLRDAEAAAAAAAAARVRAIVTESALQHANDDGVDLYERGRYADAIAAFQKALEYGPDDDVLLQNLRQAREKQADLEAQRQQQLAQDNKSEKRRRAVK